MDRKEDASPTPEGIYEELVKEVEKVHRPHDVTARWHLLAYFAGPAVIAISPFVRSRELAENVAHVGIVLFFLLMAVYVTPRIWNFMRGHTRRQYLPRMNKLSGLEDTLTTHSLSQLLAAQTRARVWHMTETGRDQFFYPLLIAAALGLGKLLLAPEPTVAAVAGHRADEPLSWLILGVLTFGVLRAASLWNVESSAIAKQLLEGAIDRIREREETATEATATAAAPSLPTGQLIANDVTQDLAAEGVPPADPATVSS